MSTKYDWSTAKTWTKAIATDKDGNSYQFHKKPKMDHQCWYLDDYDCNTCLPFFTEEIFSNWEDSLEERPK